MRLTEALDAVNKGHLTKAVSFVTLLQDIIARRMAKNAARQEATHLELNDADKDLDAAILRAEEVRDSMD